MQFSTITVSFHFVF